VHMVCQIRCIMVSSGTDHVAICMDKVAVPVAVGIVAACIFPAGNVSLNFCQIF